MHHSSGLLLNFPIWLLSMHRNLLLAVWLALLRLLFYWLRLPLKWMLGEGIQTQFGCHWCTATCCFAVWLASLRLLFYCLRLPLKWMLGEGIQTASGCRQCTATCCFAVWLASLRLLFYCLQLPLKRMLGEGTQTALVAERIIHMMILQVFRAKYTSIMSTLL